MVLASSPEVPPPPATAATPASGPDVRRVAAILRRARHAGAATLLEPEGLGLLGALGIAVPRHLVVEPTAMITGAQLAIFEGDRVVVKVVAPGIAHKSDVGGVAVVENAAPDVTAAIAEMRGQLGPASIAGFLVEDDVRHDPGFGGELLVSLRWTDDFGPVIGVGGGGIHAELLARDLQPGRELAIVAPGLTTAADLPQALRLATAVRLATEPQRGRRALISIAALVDVVERLGALAPRCGPGGILDLEINPLAVTPDGPVALDVLVTLDPGPVAAPPRATRRAGRPVWKLARLLEPASIAIAGVSGGDNAGRTILRNLIRDGFDPDRITVVKPGVEFLDGCRCVPDVGSLPGKVDLLVVAVSAARAASIVAERLGALAPRCGPGGILDLEINPLAVTPDGPVALDVLVTLDPGPVAAPARATRRAGRPVWKLTRLLEPASIAIAGVSGGDNPGRTILRNLIRDGFDPDRITVVKPGVEFLDGCRCVPDVGSLPGKVDLLVVAVSAARAASIVAEVAERDAAESIIVIPGGLEEKAGGDLLAGRMRAALDAARRRPGGGPLVNGGNCLGIRSRPGRYDTFFIPEAKLAPPSGHPAPLAIVAQSGAFALSRMSRLHRLDPKYVISVGNQMDLTIGDHLRHLADDPGIRVVGVYVEGFAPLDGRAFVGAARTIGARGGTVILYRAGRTAAGASASASHTAAIAGDALVTEQLARGAGVVVAETIEAFDDLLRTFVLLDGRVVAGRRLGAVSNAGFECVAIADNLGGLEPARFGAATEARLAEILEGAGLTDVIDVHNPFDLTPMGDDATFAAIAEAILADEGVDVGLVGDVPFTAALQTLPAGSPAGSGGTGEDLAAPGAIAPRLVDLWQRTGKAWVTVVDAGPRYDPLARALEAGGIPTFRTADAALRALGAAVERSMAGGTSVDGRARRA